MVFLYVSAAETTKHLLRNSPTRRIVELLAAAATSEARRLAIEQHLPLVYAVARRFAHRGEPLEDLVQVGALGLIKAVDRFDPARGVTLGAYAAPTIAGEIRRHLRDRVDPDPHPA